MDCFSQPSKPNTRIPPILMARQTQALEQTTTKANVAAQDQFSRLAALSKQRLYREGQTGDPDLRRCIGHHQLLCRTIMEAKDHMKRYLEDVLESESDSDSDSEDEDEILYEKGPVYTESPQTDEDEDVEGLLFPPKKQPQQQPQQLQQPPTGTTTTTTTTTITTNNDSSPSPRVKQKIFGVVKGLVRRRSTPRDASPSFTAPALEEKTTPLVHIAEKNFSCSQLPVRIHIHEDVVRDGIKGLKRSHSQDTLSTKSASFGMRGRQYAQTLGIKVPAAVSVAT